MYLNMFFFKALTSKYLTFEMFILGLEKETCLIPLPPQQLVESSQSYTLLTENLIFTQLAQHLGFSRYIYLQIKTSQPSKKCLVVYLFHRCSVCSLCWCHMSAINPCCLVLFVPAPVHMHNVLG